MADAIENTDGYITIDGQKVLVGKYNFAIRQHYLKYRTARYLIDHPDATEAQAVKHATHAWREKAKYSMGRGRRKQRA